MAPAAAELAREQKGYARWWQSAVAHKLPGHVDDFLIDEASWRVDYLVVDTSNWIGGKWVLIAPTTLTGIDWPNSKLQVGLTRDAVKDSPSIDAVTIAPGEDGPPFMII